MKKILKNKLLISLVLACLVPAMSYGHEVHEGHESSELGLSAPSTDSLFNITDTWVASDEKTFQLNRLSGKPTVIAMVYTSCQYVCPLTVGNMKRIEKSIPSSQLGKVNFAIFTFDAERDTPSVLREFAKTHGVESPSWLLAQGKPNSVRKLAVGLGIKYKKTKSGDFEHDATITLLDEAGVIKYQTDAMNKNVDGAMTVVKQLIH